MTWKYQKRFRVLGFRGLGFEGFSAVWGFPKLGVPAAVSS